MLLDFFGISDINQSVATTGNGTFHTFKIHFQFVTYKWYALLEKLSKLKSAGYFHIRQLHNKPFVDHGSEQGKERI